MVRADSVTALFPSDAHGSLAEIRPSENLSAIAPKTASLFAVYDEPRYGTECRAGAIYYTMTESLL
jgi:hypothetical protein